MITTGMLPACSTSIKTLTLLKLLVLLISLSQFFDGIVVTSRRNGNGSLQRKVYACSLLKRENVLFFCSTPSRNMTNADFRKLMMTPRAAGATPAGATSAVGGRSERISGPGSMGPPAPKGAPTSATSSHNITERKKKKQYYASLRKAEVLYNIN